MIKVLLVSNKAEQFIEFEASGHAGMSKKGNDIICSAVTALLKTALLSLLNAEKCSADLNIKTEVQKNGRLYAKVLKFSKEDESRLHYLFEFLAIGLSALEADYPNYLSLKIESV